MIAVKVIRDCARYTYRETDEEHKFAHFNNNFWCIYHNKTHTYTVYGSAILLLLFLPHYYNNACVYAHTRCMWWCACVTVYMNVVIYLLETKQWQRGGSSRFLCVPLPLSTARVYFFFPSQPTDVLLLKKIFIFDFFSSVAGLFLLQFGSAVLWFVRSPCVCCVLNFV